MRQATKEILLITGNKDKLAEYQQIFAESNITITSADIDLPEYQGNPLNIAKLKAKLAFEKLQKPLIVEDASLCFNTLNSLPSPYIKLFFKEIKPAGVLQMLAGYKDKSAYAQCIFAYMSEELQDPICFIGRTQSLIKEAQAEVQGLNPSSLWSFQPEGYDKSNSEYSNEIKNKVSHLSIPIQKMVEHFSNENIGVK